MPTLTIDRSADFGAATKYVLGNGRDKAAQAEIAELPATSNENLTAGFEAGKRARIIATNLAGDDAKTFAEQFEETAKRRSEIKSPVIKLTINLKPGEHFEAHQWIEAVATLREDLGLVDCPFLLVQHREKPHAHAHLLSSIVAFDGRVVGDSFWRYETRTWARKIEDKYELTPTAFRAKEKSLTRAEIERALRTGTVPPRFELQQIIAHSLTENFEAGEFALALAEQDVCVKIYFDKKTNQPHGIGFKYKEKKYAGGKLGTDFTWQKLQQKGLHYEPHRDDERMAAASRRISEKQLSANAEKQSNADQPKRFAAANEQHFAGDAGAERADKFGAAKHGEPSSDNARADTADAARFSEQSHRLGAVANELGDDRTDRNFESAKSIEQLGFDDRTNDRVRAGSEATNNVAATSKPGVGKPEFDELGNEQSQSDDAPFGTFADSAGRSVVEPGTGRVQRAGSSRNVRQNFDRRTSARESEARVAADAVESDATRIERIENRSGGAASNSTTRKRFARAGNQAARTKRSGELRWFERRVERAVSTAPGTQSPARFGGAKPIVEPAAETTSKRSDRAAETENFVRRFTAQFVSRAEEKRPSETANAAPDADQKQQSNFADDEQISGGAAARADAGTKHKADHLLHDPRTEPNIPAARTGALLRTEFLGTHGERTDAVSRHNRILNNTDSDNDGVSAGRGVQSDGIHLHNVPEVWNYGDNNRSVDADRIGDLSVPAADTGRNVAVHAQPNQFDFSINLRRALEQGEAVLTETSNHQKRIQIETQIALLRAGDAEPVIEWIVEQARQAHRETRGGELDYPTERRIKKNLREYGHSPLDNVAGEQSPALQKIKTEVAQLAEQNNAAVAPETIIESNVYQLNIIPPEERRRRLMNLIDKTQVQQAAHETAEQSQNSFALNDSSYFGLNVRFERPPREPDLFSAQQQQDAAVRNAYQPKNGAPAQPAMEPLAQSDVVQEMILRNLAEQGRRLSAESAAQLEATAIAWTRLQAEQQWFAAAPSTSKFDFAQTAEQLGEITSFMQANDEKAKDESAWRLADYSDDQAALVARAREETRAQSSDAETDELDHEFDEYADLKLSEGNGLTFEM